MKTAFVDWAVAAGLALAGVAWAQTPQPQPVPPSNWTPQQIRQAFDQADADGNGELTRAEAQLLKIMPRTFEEMDSNKDNVVTRAEYEAVFKR